MSEFDKIYLSWRREQGKRRHIVGVLEKHPDNRFTFKYEPGGVEAALKEGFSAYTEFADFEKTYNGNVLDVFAERLMKSERTDIQSFYDFWEIEPQFAGDKFYLLGHSQGLLPTDNFEFLADYQPLENLHFLTDLARVSDKNLTTNSVVSGDILHYKMEQDNPHDEFAVKVFKGQTEIGYIKKIHSKVFYRAHASGKTLKVTAKAIGQNGHIKRIFVKVSF